MLRRLSLTVKDQKELKHEVRGAAVPYHEPTSTDDDDDDVDVDDDTSVSASSRGEGRSWPSTPSTPTSSLSTMSSASRALSPPPFELSARALMWSSPPCSPTSPAVDLPQCRDGDVQQFHDKRHSLAALATSGDVDGLKAALKEDSSSVNDTNEVQCDELLMCWLRHRKQDTTCPLPLSPLSFLNARSRSENDDRMQQKPLRCVFDAVSNTNTKLAFNLAL